jgi:hypothetical protein
MWDAVGASGLPVHFHTIGSGVRRDFTKLAPKVALAVRALVSVAEGHGLRRAVRRS